MRHAGGTQGASPVAAADHRLCRSAARRPCRVDWPESTLAMQRNWIGRSEGAEVVFRVAAAAHADGTAVARLYDPSRHACTARRIWCSRPSMRLLKKSRPPERQAAVSAYQELARRKSDLERTDLAKEKTRRLYRRLCDESRSTGKRSRSGSPIMFLSTYGTGAIMAVPAHDERDFAFATKFKLPIVEVVRPVAGGVISTLPRGRICRGGDGGQFGRSRRPADG